MVVALQNATCDARIGSFNQRTTALTAPVESIPAKWKHIQANQSGRPHHNRKGKLTNRTAIGDGVARPGPASGSCWRTKKRW